MTELKTSNGAPSGEAQPVAGRRLSNLCLLVLAGALLVLASPWLAHLWLGFDVLTHFVPHFAFVAAGAFLCLLVPSVRGLLVALALPVLGALAIGGVSWWHASPGFDAPATERRIRIMSYNSWLWNEDVEAITQEVQRNRPDIFGVVEFHPPKFPLRGRLRKMFPYQADCARKRHCNIALFSRWPIESVKSASHWVGPPYMHAVIRTPQGPVRVFVVHTLRFPWLGSQYEQVRAMARIVRLQKGPVIVMGDFNASPFSIMLERFLKDTGLKRLNWLPTWPARPWQLPQLAIDHVFVSRHWRLAAGPWAGRPAGSDHLPVILELVRRPESAPGAPAR